MGDLRYRQNANQPEWTLKHCGISCFSPDGKKVVTESFDHSARVWDAKTGKTLVVLTGHDDILRAANFSPSGEQVITASNDGTARIWDAATGKLITTLSGHSNYIYAAMFSPDGKCALTCAYDNKIRIWNSATGVLSATIPGTENAVGRPFSPDGTQLIANGPENAATIWQQRP